MNKYKTPIAYQLFKTCSKQFWPLCVLWREPEGFESPNPTPDEIITVSVPVKKCWRGNTILGDGESPPPLSLSLSLSLSLTFSLSSQLFLLFPLTHNHKHTFAPLLPEMYIVLYCSRSLYASSNLSARLSERTKRKKRRKVILIYSTGGVWGVLHYMRKFKNKGQSDNIHFTKTMIYCINNPRRRRSLELYN